MLGEKRNSETESEKDDEKLCLSSLKEETRIDEDIIQQNIDKRQPIVQPEVGKHYSFRERVLPL